VKGRIYSNLQFCRASEGTRSKILQGVNFSPAAALTAYQSELSPSLEHFRSRYLQSAVCPGYPQLPLFQPAPYFPPCPNPAHLSEPIMDLMRLSPPSSSLLSPRPINRRPPPRQSHSPALRCSRSEHRRISSESTPISLKNISSQQPPLPATSPFISTLQSPPYPNLWRGARMAGIPQHIRHDKEPHMAAPYIHLIQMADPSIPRRNRDVFELDVHVVFR